MQPTDAIPPKAMPEWLRGILIAVVIVIAFGAVVGLLSLLNSNDAATTPPQSKSLEGVLALSARLEDEAPVIGVSAGGRHKAYPLKILFRPSDHVCNDLLGGVPITVTFCNLDRCVRVFTAPERKEPLDMAVGGWDASRPRKLLVRIGETIYWQDTGLPLDEKATGSIPYGTSEFTETTWGKWRAAHPDTEVYSDKGLSRTPAPHEPPQPVKEKH